MLTITPATYPTQQTQPRLPMATETIARTLTEGTTQLDTAQQISQPADEPGRLGRSIPFGANQLGTSDSDEAQI